MNKKRLIALLCICVLLVVVIVGCSGNKFEKYAAKVNGVAITRSIFANILNTELSLLYSEAPENLSFDDFGTEDFYKHLKEEKNADGETYYNQLVESTLEQSQLFIINVKLAEAAKEWPSEDELEETRKERQELLESAVSYYGAETADELCIMMYGIPLEDHIEYYALSGAVDDFNSAKMEGMTVDEDDLFAFYEAHFDDYEDVRVRTVQVRHSLFLTTKTDDEGNEVDLTAAEKTALKATVDGYVEAYKNGTMTMDEIVALSADATDGVPNNDGYYDVTEDANYVEEFLDWAMSREVVSDELEVIETDYGYHIMQCTKIWTLSYEDDAVKDVVDMDFRGDLLEKELKDLAKEDRYAIKNRRDDIIDSFVKQIVTGNYEGSEPIETESATPAPEYNDAEASEEIVGTLGDMNLYRSDYSYFFSSAVLEIVGTDFKVDNSLSEEEQYQQLRDFLDSPYKDEGITYLQRSKDRALELLTQFMLTWKQAVAEGETLTEEEIETLNSEVDSIVDQYVSYYGSTVGVSTRDAMMEYMMGMNVNEYKRLNLLQTIVSNFSSVKMEEMEVTDDTLKDYYGEYEEDFRVVTVRHIFLSLLDDKGNAVSAEKKAEVKAVADQLIQKIKNGDTTELLVQVWSEDANAEYDLGLVDITAGNTDLDESIAQWALGQTSMGAATVKLFETTSGYEIVLVEGILEYDGQQGITASEETTVDSLKTTIETAYKNEEFQKLVDGYVAASGLTVENINEAIISQVVDEYLTYEPTEEEDEDNSEESGATADASEATAS